ncbi:uncharacterized protein DNG_04150 [Cephalotrichum gorgonifer]|uniref:Zn(2)-C6 fungal-type domain-containing protein n=1 Tax=Cephalotrichum gorgonifer TaxID=2041049 RepID=A0AAE8MXW6_9PEZI|nr:uncharacterized protein DNG_04150 [Cephalotrichum gorgonifer]
MPESAPHITVLEPAKKRRRPALSCEQCRRRKVRCDRGTPCTTCVQSGVRGCSYVAPPRPVRAPNPYPQVAIRPTPPGSSTSASPDASSASASASASTGGHPATSSTDPGEWTLGRTLMDKRAETRGDGGAVDVQSLLDRIRQLEWEVRSAKGPASGDVPPRASPLKGIVEKTRYFGQSHWINAVCLFPLLVGLARKCEEKKSGLKLYAVLRECKTIGRLIKAQRMPVLTSTSLGEKLVSLALSDHLLEIYLSTFELTHRILHIPSFRKEYARFRADPTSVSQSFRIQLQLCLAIGASMHDDKFSYRIDATRWVYEARLWLILPSEKERISVTGLQVMCLLMVARQTVGVAPGVAWPDAGALLRCAVFGGLHRDPSRLPAMSVLHAEVRRRLWATVLEITVQTAVESGAPTMLSLDDYDTEPPLDVDDDQLTDDPEPEERIIRPPAAGHSQTSLQLLLLTHLPVRLAVTKFANDFRSTNSYAEALTLHDQITSSCDAISRRLARLVPETSSSSAPVTMFHQRYVDVSARKFIFALHYPFISRLDDPAYYFSRKVLSDAARRIAAMHMLPHVEAGALPPAGVEHFVNLSICSTGFARMSMQAFILLGPELLALKKEEINSYGEAGEGGAELRRLLDEAVVWSQARMRAGETNAKGCMFVEAILAEVDGVAAGYEGKGLEDYIHERMTRSVQETLEVMKQVARESGIEVQGEGKGDDDGDREGGSEGVGNAVVDMNMTTPIGFQDEMGSGNPFDGLGWHFDWEDNINLSALLS